MSSWSTSKCRDARPGCPCVWVGVGLAKVLDIHPAIGLITGSITLTGGHGTAGAWGPTLEKEFGIGGATGLGIAAATFGLVFGGLIGGPVARRLINKQGRAKVSNNGDQADNYQSDDAFESHGKTHLITADSAVETLALFAACLAFTEIIKTALIVFAVRAFRRPPVLIGRIKRRFSRIL